MDSNNIQSILQAALEIELPSSQIQLWPAVRASLIAENYLLKQQRENMNAIQSRRTSRMAVVTVIIVALLAFVFITPQGRAFARTAIRSLSQPNPENP
jgi:hypothetical protein